MRIGWTASLACLGLLVALDIWLDSSVAVLTGLFAISPLIACAVLPTVSTAAVWALSLAAAIASGFWDDSLGTPQQTVRIVGVLLIGGTAVAIAEVRVRRERRYAQMAQIAEAAQRAILPVLPHQAGGIDITARYESAVEGALVGGDLYDCYFTNDVTRLLIGDVRGKGIGGVEQAARVIRAFRQAAARQSTLADVAMDMDDYLVPFFDDEEFVTALLVETIGADRLAVVSCGHPPALLLRHRDGLTSVEVPHGLPLGTGLPATFAAAEMPWAPGDRLLLYTDGLSEARDQRGEFLDLAELAIPLAGQHALDGILDAVRHHVRGGVLGDDLALVLLERPVS
ncbi:PP2C family protein-serine/threonine phosphatase [Nocardioides sp. SR21]|uniref:PP2C family protein-serine/threonine phosphatase n=1 Tax=Nocardioides sp. SR21 TaxID=2919501 RepID=UPI001FAAD2BF|nr:PP2C family protein-serine/threonine phosphatase [Nocardioides sp. SR21]